MPEPDAASITRRDFLALLTRGFLGLSGLFGLGIFVRFLGLQNGSPSPTRFELGPAQNYPLNSRTLIKEAQAVIVHTASGLAAYSLVCPHLGCTIQLERDGYACPCHGSRFGAEGGVYQGPADRPMRPLRLEQTAAGELVLYTG